MNDEQIKALEDAKSVDLDALQTQLSEMSPEELQAYALKQTKAYKDQALFNQKLNNEIKEKQEPEVKVEEPKEEPKPVAPAGLSEEDAIAYSTLVAQGFSQEEIQKAKSAVGTFMGDDILSVANSAGFQAQLNKEREVSKSQDMQITDLSGLQAPTTDTQFMEQVNKGLIDLSNPTHESRYKKLVTKQMRLSRK